MGPKKDTGTVRKTIIRPDATQRIAITRIGAQNPQRRDGARREVFYVPPERSPASLAKLVMTDTDSEGESLPGSSMNELDAAESDRAKGDTGMAVSFL